MRASARDRPQSKIDLTFKMDMLNYWLLILFWLFFSLVFSLNLFFSLRFVQFFMLNAFVAVVFICLCVPTNAITVSVLLCTPHIRFGSEHVLRFPREKLSGNRFDVYSSKDQMFM